MKARYAHARCLSLAVAILFASTNAAPSQASLPQDRQLVEQIGISPKLGDRVPDELDFVDADGKGVQLGDCFDGKPVILHLVYYQCPMLCKLSSDGLLRALDTLSLEAGEDFSIVTVSFDPREGPELSAAARQVAIERYGRGKVDRGWRFLTGDEAAIESLCESVGFRYRFDEKTGQFAHASGAFVLAGDGTLSRFLSGVDFSPRDLRLAIVDASEGKVGTTVDQVLLMCYMYDPTTGKYGLTIITALRVAGIATVACIAGGIFYMLRRERRSQHAAQMHLDNSPIPS